MKPRHTLHLRIVPFLILLQETRPGVPVFGSAAGPFGAIAAGVARMFVADRAAAPARVRNDAEGNASDPRLAALIERLDCALGNDGRLL